MRNRSSASRDSEAGIRPHLRGLSMVICSLAGLGLAFNVAILDVPIYFGLVYGDFLDPDRPGHLKGVAVSTPELLIKTALAVCLLAAAGWLYRRCKSLL